MVERHRPGRCNRCEDPAVPDLLRQRHQLTHGIHLRSAGPPPSHGSTIASITDGFITGTQVGIAASNIFTEGLYIRAIEVLDANIGYLLDAPGPGTSISDCHAATRLTGIKIVDHGDMALMGNLLYGETASWFGIDCHGTGINPHTGVLDGVFGAHNLRIIGNQITRVGGGAGIQLSGYARDCVIQGNVLKDVATGIVTPSAPTSRAVSSSTTVSLRPAPRFSARRPPRPSTSRPRSPIWRSAPRPSSPGQPRRS